MERYTVLAKLELPYFIDRAFVQKKHCRLLFQVQETVLSKMRCTLYLGWTVLEQCCKLNHLFLFVSSFWSPNNVVSLSQRITASPGHGAGDSNNTIERIKVTHPFFVYTFTHLADAFIQSDLQCIQAIHLLSLCVFPGNRPHNLCAANAMLYHWATGTLGLYYASLVGGRD